MKQEEMELQDGSEPCFCGTHMLNVAHCTHVIGGKPVCVPSKDFANSGICLFAAQEWEKRRKWAQEAMNAGESAFNGA